MESFIFGVAGVKVENGKRYYLVQHFTGDPTWKLFDGSTLYREVAEFHHKVELIVKHFFPKVILQRNANSTRATAEFYDACHIFKTDRVNSVVIKRKDGMDLEFIYTSGKKVFFSEIVNNKVIFGDRSEVYRFLTYECMKQC